MGVKKAWKSSATTDKTLQDARHSLRCSQLLGVRAEERSSDGSSLLLLLLALLDTSSGGAKRRQPPKTKRLLSNCRNTRTKQNEPTNIPTNFCPAAGTISFSNLID